MRYAPVMARYKLYIIDEVHMLSTQAFNGLLKTLEEPPPHVKFIFATTEIRKVPVTVLSRCQRFDLKRIDSERLAEHLASICAKEGVKVDADAHCPDRARGGGLGARRACRCWIKPWCKSRARASAPRTFATCWASPIAAACSTLFEAIAKADAKSALSEARKPVR